LAKKLVENLLLAPDEVTSWATLRTAEQLCLRVNQWRTNTRRLGDADHAQDRLSRYTAREKFSGQGVKRFWSYKSRAKKLLGCIAWICSPSPHSFSMVWVWEGRDGVGFPLIFVRPPQNRSEHPRPFQPPQTHPPPPQKACTRHTNARPPPRTS